MGTYFTNSSTSSLGSGYSDSNYHLANDTVTAAEGYSNRFSFSTNPETYPTEIPLSDRSYYSNSGFIHRVNSCGLENSRFLFTNPNPVCTSPSNDLCVNLGNLNEEIKPVYSSIASIEDADDTHQRFDCIVPLNSRFNLNASMLSHSFGPNDEFKTPTKQLFRTEVSTHCQFPPLTISVNDGSNPTCESQLDPRNLPYFDLFSPNHLPVTTTTNNNNSNGNTITNTNAVQRSRTGSDLSDSSTSTLDQTGDVRTVNFYAHDQLPLRT